LDWSGEGVSLWRVEESRGQLWRVVLAPLWLSLGARSQRREGLEDVEGVP